MIEAEIANRGRRINPPRGSSALVVVLVAVVAVVAAVAMAVAA